MTTFVLIPGAGGSAWYWSKLVPALRAAGHHAIAVDLPGDDPHVGIARYANLTAQAAGDSEDVVLVAQSMGGFTAPLACEQITVQGLVFVNAMIPVPGESAGDWWENVGSSNARIQAARAGGYTEELDPEIYFLHDVSSDVAAEGAAYQRDEVDIAFQQPCDFTAWPNVPTLVLAGCDDRFFPAAFQSAVAHDRLGLSTERIPGGHLCALSQPAALADRLTAFNVQL
ncbi:MAG: alpha/beta hydrolase [Actinomycetota bacterium]|nr:alpha/beta hydrolase [Actinomycetota bacterium]